jgi:uncharacterized protein YdaU (DUF1376 family)
MRWLVALLIVLATILPAVAEDWTTADGKTYKNVTVINQEDDGVRITYTGGVGKIPYYELSVDLQKRFGQDVDSLAAKRLAAEKAAEEAARTAAAAELKKQQDDAAAAEMKKQEDATAAALQQKKQQELNAAQAKAQAAGNTQSGPSTAIQPAPSNGPNGPNAPTAPGQVGAANSYPGSNFGYNDSLDVCYLDSPAVDVWPEPAPAVPIPPGQGTTLTLRIVTDGHQPQVPDRIEATVLSPSAPKKADGNRNVVFIVDGAKIPINQTAQKDSGNLSGAGQAGEVASFYLSPELARSIINGKNVNFSVGTNNFKIDQAGITVLRKYLNDVDHLPPASFNLVRSYYKFLSRLPSMVSVISTVCEYIILGGFALFVAASIAAFVMGMSRFMKM